jgi:hypothetical protein
VYAVLSAHMNKERDLDMTEIIGLANGNYEELL